MLRVEVLYLESIQRTVSVPSVRSLIVRRRPVTSSAIVSTILQSERQVLPVRKSGETGRQRRRRRSRATRGPLTSGRVARSVRLSAIKRQFNTALGNYH